MIQRLDEKVMVTFEKAPQKVIYGGREHTIEKIGLHHTYRAGRTLYHVFSVASDNLFFRLVLDTDNLLWRLTEVSDGQTN